MIFFVLNYLIKSPDKISFQGNLEFSLVFLITGKEIVISVFRDWRLKLCGERRRADKKCDYEN
jgi:hypothetical protein